MNESNSGGYTETWLEDEYELKSIWFLNRKVR